MGCETLTCMMVFEREPYISLCFRESISTSHKNKKASTNDDPRNVSVINAKLIYFLISSERVSKLTFNCKVQIFFLLSRIKVVH